MQGKAGRGATASRNDGWSRSGRVYMSSAETVLLDKELVLCSGIPKSGPNAWPRLIRSNKTGGVDTTVSTNGAPIGS